MADGVRVKVEADGALAALAEMAGRVEQTRLFAFIGASLVASTQQRFLRGMGPDGSPWPPSLRVLGMTGKRGGKTLIDTARLMKSISYRATPRSVEVGTNVVYAAIHQFGGEIRHAARGQVLHFRRTRSGGARFAKASDKRARFAQKVSIGAHTSRMPARPFLGLDDDDNRELAAIAGDFIAGPARVRP